MRLDERAIEGQNNVSAIVHLANLLGDDSEDLPIEFQKATSQGLVRNGLGPARERHPRSSRGKAIQCGDRV